MSTEAKNEVDLNTQTKQKIVICGGGNAAHVFCALSASQSNNEVHLLSLYKTEAADFAIAINKTDEKLLTADIVKSHRLIKSKPFNITNNPKCLENADIVIISLPAFAHSQYLNACKENITPTKDKSCVRTTYPESDYNSDRRIFIICILKQIIFRDIDSNLPRCQWR